MCAHVHVQDVIAWLDHGVTLNSTTLSSLAGVSAKPLNHDSYSTPRTDHAISLHCRCACPRGQSLTRCLVCYIVCVDDVIDECESLLSSCSVLVQHSASLRYQVRDATHYWVGHVYFITHQFVRCRIIPAGRNARKAPFVERIQNINYLRGSLDRGQTKIFSNCGLIGQSFGSELLQRMESSLMRMLSVPPAL